MPTLFRLIVVVAILAAVVWGTMYGLATFVKPFPRQMTERIPTTRLDQ